MRGSWEHGSGLGVERIEAGVTSCIYEVYAIIACSVAPAGGGLPHVALLDHLLHLGHRHLHLLLTVKWEVIW